MWIYLGGSCIYGFEWQRAFETRYISGNFLENQKLGKYDQNKIDQGGNIVMKS